MPVRKYRNVEDVPSNPVMDDGGPAAALRMAFSLSALALRLAASRPPPGVYKCQSLEEAQRLRQQRGAGG
jgi:hypothetical protein